jgi:amino acid permease
MANLGTVTGMLASVVGGLTATAAIPVALVGAGVVGYFGGETVDRSLTWILPGHRKLFHRTGFWLGVTAIGAGITWVALGSTGRFLRYFGVLLVVCLGWWCNFHLYQDDELI